MEQNIITLNSYIFEVHFKEVPFTDISIVLKNYEGFQD
jgi:hypothetical protein